MRNNVKVIEIRVKEKDQELKLAEMKIRELKKQMRHTKLKPLGPRSQGRVVKAANTPNHF
jgi:hypothetical protein